MQHFRYIDTIRRPDGTLRPWREHDVLARYDSLCNDARRLESSFIAEANRIIEAEYKAKLKWK